MAHKHNTATDKQMQDFTRHITALFVEKCDKRSYKTPDEVRNSWLYEGEYSAEAEAFLILQTQTYIRNLNSNDPKSTNPDFLKVFIKRIADYLSAYTMRAGKKRKQAKDDLFAILYTNSQYIQLLTEKQEQKRKAGFLSAHLSALQHNAKKMPSLRQNVHANCITRSWVNLQK